VAVEVAGGGGVAVGSRALLAQLVANLAQNAIVHNLPSGGKVLIATHATPQAAILTVENSGPIVPAELARTLTEPFQRGARHHGADGGVGLGLAIVASITRAHDGALHLAARPAGGLSAIVQLPLAPTTDWPRRGG
jgi:two-component system sensor histidine kinase VanS